MRGNRWLKCVDFWIGVPACFLLGWWVRLRERGRVAWPAAVRRVLVFKLGAVGDTVLLPPALRALRARYPQAHITWMASPVNLSVADGWADIDVVESLELSALMRSPLRLFRVIRRLRAARYDLVVDFEQWMRLTSFLTLMTRAPVRVGCNSRGQGRGLAYNLPYEPPPDTHEVDHFLAIAALAGAATSDRCIVRPPPEPSRAWARALIGDAPHPRVALHPGCGKVGAPRQWSVERYAAVADALAQTHGASVFITGGSGEETVTSQVATAMRTEARVLCRSFSYAEFSALLEAMDVVVCANTGAMHIAAAVGTPTVALHGPTNPRRWGPLGEGHIVLQSPLPCSPCLDLGFEYGCDEHPCMKTISVGEVIAAVHSLLDMRVGAAAG